MCVCVGLRPGIMYIGNSSAGPCGFFVLSTILYGVTSDDLGIYLYTLIATIVCTIDG